MKKKEQKSTKIDIEEAINKKTGLSPIQEKAIFSLLSGSKISDVATQLSIDRSTIYLWQEKENFQAYYNYLKGKIKFITETNLIGLYNESLQVIKESLNSQNESMRIKSALWIVENILSQEKQETDPIKIIKAKCEKEAHNFDLINIFFDKNLYQSLLKDNNLD